MLQKFDPEAARKCLVPPVRSVRQRVKDGRIRPIISKESRPWYIEPPDILAGYMDEAKPQKPATDLVLLHEITTYHLCRHAKPSGEFTPSISEVVAQIPDQYLAKTAAFEIIGPPEHFVDIRFSPQSPGARFHRVVTRLYSKKRF